jgi:hypothetical protein
MGGTAKGAGCYFPFKYRGVTFNKCTKSGHSKRRLWCGAANGKWGHCTTSCIYDRKIKVDRERGWKEQAEKGRIYARERKGKHARINEKISKRSQRAKPPAGAGCWMYLPSGCRKHPHEYHANTWLRDTRGERKKGAGASSKACLRRKAAFDQYCGVQDTKALFNPRSSSATPHSNMSPTSPAHRAFKISKPASQSAADTAAAKALASMTATAMSHIHAYINLTRTGKRKLLRLVRAAKRIRTSVESPGVVPSAAQEAKLVSAMKAVKAAKHQLSRLKKVTVPRKVFAALPARLHRYTIVHGWLHPHAKVAKSPAKPGCWMYLPSGCRKHPAAYRPFIWLRDHWGEAHRAAAKVRSACVMRKKSFNWWCGVSDVRTRYVAAKEPFSAYESHVPQSSMIAAKLEEADEMKLERARLLQASGAKELNGKVTVKQANEKTMKT